MKLFFLRLYHLAKLYAKLYMPLNNKLYKERIEICKKCKHFNSKKYQCGTLADVGNPNTEPCGCFLKVKGRMAGMTCPIQKW